MTHLEAVGYILNQKKDVAKEIVTQMINSFSMG